jgi:hypothetical protein
VFSLQILQPGNSKPNRQTLSSVSILAFQQRLQFVSEQVYALNAQGIAFRFLPDIAQVAKAIEVGSSFSVISSCCLSYKHMYG